MEILLIGDRLRIVANGQLVSAYKAPPETFKECPLGLQLHGNKTPQKIMFRGLIAVRNPTDILISLKDDTAPKTSPVDARQLEPVVR